MKMSKLLLPVALLVSMSGFGQTKQDPLALGFHFGTKQYNGELGNEFFTTSDLHAAIGVSISQYVSPSFDGVFMLSHGQIDKGDFFSSFTTKLLDFNLLAKYKLNNGYILKEESRFAPFLHAGVGDALAWGTPYGNKNSSFDFNFPIGGGFNLRLSEKTTCILMTSYNYSMSDKYDAIDNTHQAGNKRDRFLFTSIGMVFRLRSGQDTDGDGVKNRDDNCPEVAGLEQLAGCPDKDDDGVTDSNDKCPALKGLVALNGCPDQDSDGIADNEDQCPTQKGTEATNGCPDTDGDGIIDKDDQCPEVAGIPEFGGCIDSDKDGLPDNNDECPSNAGPVNLKGCPDSDNDGVSDKNDRCPEEAGIASNKGCPEIKEEVKEIFAQALKGVKFETAKDVIKTSSYPILNKVVDVMKNNPVYKLEILGHTDSQGEEEKNLRLSQKRADSVKSYLVDKGVAVSSIVKSQGFGEAKPIDTNETAGGRANNRRVEFKVVFE